MQAGFKPLNPPHPHPQPTPTPPPPPPPPPTPPPPPPPQPPSPPPPPPSPHIETNAFHHRKDTGEQDGFWEFREVVVDVKEVEATQTSHLALP